MKLCYRGVNYTSESIATSNVSQHSISLQYRGAKQQVLITSERAGVQVSYPLTYRGTAYTEPG
jgi:hypothetical protein